MQLSSRANNGKKLDAFHELCTPVRVLGVALEVIGWYMLTEEQFKWRAAYDCR